MSTLMTLSPGIDQLVPLCFFLLLSYVAVSVTYNIYFHPLAHIPGPFFAKVSQIPSFYHACKGDRHVWLWQNFQKYGHKIRIYPDGIVYNDPRSYAQIYNNKANVRRANYYEAWQRNKHDVNTLNTCDLSIHARKRRLLNLVFTDRAVRAAGSFVNKHVDRWHELLVPSDNKGWSSARDLSDELDRMSLDLLGDLCFGRSFNLKEPGDNPFRAVPHTIAEYMKFMYPVARSPFVDALLWLKPRGLDSLFDAVSPAPVKAYFKFVEQSVTDRLALEKENEARRDADQHVREDMFHFLMQAKDPETGKSAYSEQELRCEANLLIIAGSDTTATSICGFFFYLSQDQRVYTKLVEEIRSTFSSADEIVGGAKLSGCQYLRACLDESMRLTPPGPSELSRTILAGGMEVDGDFLPAGTTVGSAGWCAGRNETYFRDVNVYRPERWIVDDAAGNTTEMVAEIRECIKPFSTGPGNCVGKNLAMLSMLTNIARTLHRFDVRRAPDTTLGQGRPELGWGRRDEHQYQLRDAYISLREGPMLQFRSRAG